jgi:hypothetical protein
MPLFVLSFSGKGSEGERRVTRRRLPPIIIWLVTYPRLQYFNFGIELFADAGSGASRSRSDGAPRRHGHCTGPLPTEEFGYPNFCTKL